MWSGDTQTHKVLSHIHPHMNFTHTHTHMHEQTHKALLFSYQTFLYHIVDFPPLGVEEHPHRLSLLSSSEQMIKEQ